MEKKQILWVDDEIELLKPHIIYLNDTDVSMRFTLSMVTYSRNETGHITGFRNNWITSQSIYFY